MSSFKDPGKKTEIIVGKEENAGNQHFLLFKQYFLGFFFFFYYFPIFLQVSYNKNAADFGQSKILLFDK